MTRQCCILGALALIVSLCFQRGNPFSIRTEPPLGPDETCDTPDCIVAAAGMVGKMDFSVDPCQDFNEFACGRALREYVIPEGMTNVGTIIDVLEENRNILHDIIIGESTPTQPLYMRNIKRFYRSCNDEARNEAIGLTPYFNDKEFVDDWPTLNPSWSEEAFNLNEAVARYSRVLVNPIFSYYIYDDMTNSSRLTIHLTHGDLGMSQEYYKLGRNSTVISAYEKYLVEVAVELNVSRDVAERDARGVVDLEIELAKIMVPREEQRDFSKRINPVQLNELPRLYPQVEDCPDFQKMFWEGGTAVWWLNGTTEPKAHPGPGAYPDVCRVNHALGWCMEVEDCPDFQKMFWEGGTAVWWLNGTTEPKAHPGPGAYPDVCRVNHALGWCMELDIAGTLTSIFSLVNITLEDDERVINTFPTYIGNISSVLEKFQNRTIQNLFGFKYALSRTNHLTRRMRDIQQDFDRVYEGNTAEQPRWAFCVDSTSQIFWEGMGKQFVNRRFSEEAKRDVNDMIDNLKEVFMQMIDEATWMGESTKQEARVKLTAMNRKIGYPDVDFEEADIEKLYEKYTMKEDDFYNNRILCDHLRLLEHLSTYRTPVDKNKFRRAPYEVNAYYNFLKNEIVFLAGIMQAPFYSKTFPDYMNYGAIGAVIGHEITHGFDDKGSQFDENGTLRNWWAGADRQNFVEKATCIINQNSNIHLEEINMNLNGRNTQGETMADRGGLKEAFRAYKNHVCKTGLQPRLPGLHLSQDQVFFLSFAQTFCEKLTLGGLIKSVTTGSHPPDKYRLLGTLQNSEDFAKAYNCSQGSFMNPVKKCNVW